MMQGVQMFDAKYRQLTIKLDRIAPRFNLPSGSVKILQEPDEFYRTFKDKILKSKRRIFVSTLYVGKAEMELVC